LICFEASIPSIPGIRMSIKTRSISELFRQISTDSSPFLAQIIEAFVLFK
jgi:hypothetical protein